MSQKFCLTLVALTSWLSSTQVAAQIPTPFRPSLPSDLPSLAKPFPKESIAPSEPPALRLDLPEATPPQAPEIPARTVNKLRVSRFIFQGNTVFSNEELEAVTAPYTGREITFAELLEARSAINKLYYDNGYITSGALIPPQTGIASGSEDATVTIQIVEGRLEAIEIEGSPRLDRYIRDRLPQGVLNQPRLLEALRLLSVDPLINNISASLTAGSEPGLNILMVKVEPTEPFSLAAIASNHRSPASGTFERGLELEQRHLLGLGDSLQVAYKNTDGSNGIAASYSIPINRQNGTVRLSYSELHNNIVEEPFNELDILSRQRAYELSFRQPLVRRATEDSTQEFALEASISRSESDSELLGFQFPLSPGADERGRTRISALRFSQDFRQESSREILAARSQLSVGVGAFGATINSEPPDSRFVVWRGQVGWLRKLGGDTSLLLRGNIQLADRPLVPLEQFSLGGEGSVRGYRQDLLIADSGASASAELYIPILDGDSGTLQVIPFFDLGTVWNNDRDLEGDTSTLASLGLGLQYSLGDRFSARLDYGFPLVPIDSQGSSWQENGLTFSLRYQPF